METNLEVLFTPAEFSALNAKSLSGVVCIVFDVLRATSSMLTALGNGASRIFPVCEISEAMEMHRAHPNALLAGERHGARILGAQTGGVDFDLGNSPREFTRERIGGREVIMTTTNGTRALQSCVGALRILAGGFLNLRALADFIEEENAVRVLVVCAGTYQEAAYEDTLAAGALCDLVWRRFAPDNISDSAQIARQIYLDAGEDFENVMALSRNARRLLANPDLRDDVAFCLRRDALKIIAELRHGVVSMVER